jgi:hypothetical protein
VNSGERPGGPTQLGQVDDQVRSALDPLGLPEPLGVVEKQADQERSTPAGAMPALPDTPPRVWTPAASKCQSEPERRNIPRACARARSPSAGRPHGVDACSPAKAAVPLGREGSAPQHGCGYTAPCWRLLVAVRIADMRSNTAVRPSAPGWRTSQASKHAGQSGQQRPTGHRRSDLIPIGMCPSQRGPEGE